MDRLIELITSQPLNESEIAKRSSVSRTTIWNIITERKAPSLLTIKKICAALGVNYKDYI